MLFTKCTNCIVTLILLAAGLQVQAQKAERPNWGINAGVGYGTYYGDVSHYRLRKLSDWRNLKYFLNYNKNYFKSPSVHLSLEKKLSNRSGIIFSGNYTDISMSDRYLSSDGKLRRDNPNFDRALNFNTQILDVGIAYRLKSSERSFIAPYLWLGGGFSFFDTYGNLYDGNRNPYNYALPDVKNDGTYETDLRAQLTETDATYRNSAPYANVGLGLSFRLSRAFSLGIESDIKYSFSDYLDDVSGSYKASYATPAQAYAAKPGTNIVNPANPKRGNDDGVNDFYIQNRVVFKYSFYATSNRKKSSGGPFNAPYIYPSYYPEYKTDSVRTLDKGRNNPTKDSVSDDASRIQKVHKQTDSLDSIIIKQNNVIGNLTQSVDSLNRRVDTIENKLRQTAQKQRADSVNQRLDSLQQLVNAIDRKPRKTTTDTLRRHVYQLQADSIKNDAMKKGIESGYLRTTSYNNALTNEPALRTTNATSNTRTTGNNAAQQRPTSAVAKTDQNTSDSIARMQTRRADSIQYRIDSLLRRQQTIKSDSIEKTGNRRIATVDTEIVTRTVTVKDTISRQRMEALNNKMRRLNNSNDSIKNTIDYINLQRDATQVQITNDSLRLQALRQQQRALDSGTASKPEKKGFRIFRKNNKVTNATTQQQDAVALEINKLERDLDNFRSRNTQLERQLKSRDGFNEPGSNVNRRYYADIEDELREMNRQLGRERRYTVVNPVVPVQGGNNTEVQREINQLRNELQQLRNAKTGSQPGVTSDSSSTQTANNTAKLDEMTRTLETVSRELSALRKQSNQPAVARPTANVVSVYFNSGSASASAAQRTKLTRLRPALEGSDAISIELKAYTDATGNLQVNEALSKKRAEYVKNYLVQQFNVPDENIEVSINPSSNASGRVSNPLDRRVDIVINSKQ
ncbi:MAG TPA: OmpA family protein [Flavisolibacter sp.]|nr:OmpA family protein [Flavisolibacter sp.]